MHLFHYSSMIVNVLLLTSHPWLGRTPAPCLHSKVWPFPGRIQKNANFLDFAKCSFVVGFSRFIVSVHRVSRMSGELLLISEKEISEKNWNIYFDPEKLSWDFSFRFLTGSSKIYLQTWWEKNNLDHLSSLRSNNNSCVFNCVLQCWTGALRIITGRFVVALVESSVEFACCYWEPWSYHH